MHWVSSPQRLWSSYGHFLSVLNHKSLSLYWIIPFSSYKISSCISIFRKSLPWTLITVQLPLHFPALFHLFKGCLQILCSFIFYLLFTHCALNFISTAKQQTILVYVTSNLHIAKSNEHILFSSQLISGYHCNSQPLLLHWNPLSWHSAVLLFIISHWLLLSCSLT